MTKTNDFATTKKLLRRKVVAITLDAVVTTDEHSTIVDWNGQAETIFGFSTKEVIGTNLCHSIIPTEYASAHIRGMKHYLQTGEGVVLGKRIEVQALHKQGYLFPIELCINPVVIGGKKYFIAFIRDLTEIAKLRENEKLLIKELNHRVKNNLAIIASLVSQTIKSCTDMQTLNQVLHQRLNALIKGHQLLFESDYHGADIVSITHSVIFPFTHKTNITAEGPAFELNAQIALCYALALNELCTNSVKYGALSTKQGKVAIRWKITGDDLQWSWSEKDGPPVVPPTKIGFGSKLIKANLSSYPDSLVQFHWYPSGLVVELTTVGNKR